MKNEDFLDSRHKYSFTFRWFKFAYLFCNIAFVSHLMSVEVYSIIGAKKVTSLWKRNSFSWVFEVFFNGQCCLLTFVNVINWLITMSYITDLFAWTFAEFICSRHWIRCLMIFIYGTQSIKCWPFKGIFILLFIFILATVLKLEIVTGLTLVWMFLFAKHSIGQTIHRSNSHVIQPGIFQLLTEVVQQLDPFRAFLTTNINGTVLVIIYL